MILLASVIYNQPNYVRKSLEAIKKNTESPFFWILWVNDPPYEFDWDKMLTLFVDGAFKRHNRLFKFSDKNIGNAAGYEAAWALAEKKMKEPPTLYVKADDDTVILTPGWDKVFRRAFELDPKLGILSVDIDVDKQTGPSKISEIGEGLRIEEFENPCVGGGFTAYSAKMRQEIGGLKTDLGLYAGEDVEMCTRARAAGWKTAYLLNARCTHLCRSEDGKYREDADEAFGEWKRLAHARVMARMQGCPEEQLPGTGLPFEEWMEEMS